MTTYAGAWKRATLPVSRVPLKPGPDPQHSRPTDDTDPNTLDHTGAPGLPVEWSGGQYMQLPVASMFVDRTPVTHEDGTGFLPGVDLPEAQAVGGQARSIDWGAPDVRDFERPQYQEDGSTHVQIVSPDFHGASPADLQYDEKGVGIDRDPYARSNTAIHRRPTGPAQFDMRWYGAEYRPRLVQTAKGSRARPALADRQPNTPDSPRGMISRPDNWAAPVTRRAAAQWDQPWTVDDQTTPPGETNFGLGAWGL